MSFFHENMLIGSSGQGGAAGYQIQRSLRFNSADSAYLSRTPASAGNRRTWTWAGWVKVSNISGTQAIFSADGTAYAIINLRTSGQLRIEGFDGATTFCDLFSTPLYRDPSAWYHFVVSVDSTRAISSDRVKLYVNNVEQGLTGTYPSSTSQDWAINSTSTHYIGSYNLARYFSGYLADVHFIDGQALTPTSFGEFDTNNVWQPKAYSGTYGTNGFRLDFSDNSAATATTLGKDRAGSNNWTPNNLSVTSGAGNDSLVDSPSNYGTDTGAGGEVRGNYCTWNPLNSTSGFTLVNGNLELTGSGGGGTFHNSRGTFALNDAKFYWETVVAATKTYQHWGIVPTDTPLETGGSEALGQTEIPNSVAIVCGTGNIIENSNTLSAGSGALSTNDIIGHAFDGTTGKYWISINGVWRTGNPSAGTTPLTTVSLSRTWLCGVSEASSQTLVANFGQRPFAYAAPSGFKALCTQNLPTPTITNGATAMDVKLYTGTDSSQAITGLGFSPDLVWGKTRNGSLSHVWMDTVRGTGVYLRSNLTSADAANTDVITSFNSNGFTLGSSSALNSSAYNYAAWCWDAGSSTVTNTSGTISSQVRANTSAGFSVATFAFSSSGTVGHGLGVAPSFIIVKARDLSTQWFVYHRAIGVNSYIRLSFSGPSVSFSGAWDPVSSTVFRMEAGLHSTGSNYVAYCWSQVANYSAFGSYIGNGLADGPMVYTGFRPRWLLIKNITAASSVWLLLDTARDTINVAGRTLVPDDSTAESGNDSRLDFLSNGFKIRNTYGNQNNNGEVYIYAAFSEHPFALARAR